MSVSFILVCGVYRLIYPCLLLIIKHDMHVISAKSTHVGCLQTILGHGIDCHLLGLRECAVDACIPMPDFFKDEGFRLANHFTMSTSQVYNNHAHFSI